jgi:hypothetical protein
MYNFRLYEVPWWFSIKSQSGYLILLFTAICTYTIDKMWPVYKFRSTWAFFYFFYDSQNNLLLRDIVKTHRGSSNNRQFDMKTMKSLQMD